MGVHLRSLRSWLLPEATLGQSLTAIRLVMYGVGVGGSLLAGALGQADATLPLRLALLGFLGLYLFGLGPLHPKRIRAVLAYRERPPGTT